MAAFDLRPLSLGEILDRTFSIYRGNFLLFVGIAGIPQILVLALNLARLFLLPQGAAAFNRSPLAVGAMGVALAIVAVVLMMLAYLLSQGAVIQAVTDLYLGRPTSISQSLASARHELGTLFGVAVLNGLAAGIGFILLIIPGIYVLSRSLVCVPAALTERLGPRASLSRSWDLTKNMAGRAFMIFLLYFVVLFALTVLVSAPLGVLAAGALATQSGLQQMWLSLATVGNSIVTILVTPILLIATAIFYFDLRVRKEAFDLQFMMNPDAERFAGPSSGVPSILS